MALRILMGTSISARYHQAVIRFWPIRMGIHPHRLLRPKERPLTPRDVLATIYRHLGIDPRREFKDFSGRPVPILPDGEPIRELC